MALGRIWDYVASGARVSGGRGFGRSGEAAPGGGTMAGPRPLSRAELDQLRWTDRPEGCSAQSRHVQVAELVQRVLRGGGRAASVVVEVPAGLPVVVADGRRLESALAGLVDHAIRRSPAGAKVLISAEAVPGRGARGGAGSGPGQFAGWSGGWVSGPGASPGAGPGAGPDGDRARVELRVADRGSSEPPETRQWLLAGVRADGPAGPAAAGLVRAAGGRLTAESTPGGGLTLVLALAVARD
ncbi:hypothetical protein ACWGB8_12450 [Kitasatospora sp. NPDC054939]